MRQTRRKLHMILASRYVFSIFCQHFTLSYQIYIYLGKEIILSIRYRSTLSRKIFVIKTRIDLIVLIEIYRG